VNERLPCSARHRSEDGTRVAAEGSNLQQIYCDPA